MKSIKEWLTSDYTSIQFAIRLTVWAVELKFFNNLDKQFVWVLLRTYLYKYE